MEKAIQNNLHKIKAIFKKYGASSAYIFGSAVKNNFNNSSDVDFLYSFPDGLDYETYANNYFEMANELENLLNKPVDLIAEKTLKNPYFIASINETKVQLL